MLLCHIYFNLQLNSKLILPMNHWMQGKVVFGEAQYKFFFSAWSWSNVVILFLRIVLRTNFMASSDVIKTSQERPKCTYFGQWLEIQIVLFIWACFNYLGWEWKIYSINFHPLTVFGWLMISKYIDCSTCISQNFLVSS